jgi:hypothetical protein
MGNQTSTVASISAPLPSSAAHHESIPDLRYGIAALPTELIVQIMQSCENWYTLLSLGSTNRKHRQVLHAYRASLLALVAPRMIPELPTLNEMPLGQQHLAIMYAAEAPLKGPWTQCEDPIWSYSQREFRGPSARPSANIYLPQHPHIHTFVPTRSPTYPAGWQDRPSSPQR